MLRSKEDEDLIVRWALFEIVDYLRESGRATSSDWINKFLGSTKAHKILYRVFEKTEIPVTRSWYRYGCFVHSNELSKANSNLSSTRNSFLHIKNSTLRTQVRALDIDLDRVREEIIHATDAMPDRVEEYIAELYYNEVPCGLGSIYQSKFGLQNTLRETRIILSRRRATFRDWLPKARSSFSLFQIASLSNPWFEDLTDMVQEFISKTEQALLKAERLIETEHLRVKHANTINGFQDFFDGKIWLPFALKTSAETVKGLRSPQIRCNQLQRQIQEMRNSNGALAALTKALSETGLTLTFNEYSSIIAEEHRNKTITNIINEMEKMYEQAPHSED